MNEDLKKQGVKLRMELKWSRKRFCCYDDERP
jgi:hypothetical protein